MSDGKIIDLDERRGAFLYTVMVLCLTCDHRWIGGVPIETSLFKLECPQCGAQNSFASFVPEDYQEHLMEWSEGKNKAPEGAPDSD